MNTYGKYWRGKKKSVSDGVNMIFLKTQTHPEHSQIQTLTFSTACKEKRSRETLCFSCTNKKYLLYLHARHTFPDVNNARSMYIKAKSPWKTVHEDGGVCGPCW